MEPTSGEVLIDSVSIATIGPRAYREHVAAVMQEDQLLSGSIADNICFFDPSFDEERMIECARLAGIHEEIMAMPMTYNSLVGDMGSSLSGGQKQRVMLARSLYRQPRILFLDEGTAHLDVDNEKYINDSLNRLQMTRISVAHRPEVSSGADRILRVARTLGRDVDAPVPHTQPVPSLTQRTRLPGEGDGAGQSRMKLDGGRPDPAYEIQAYAARLRSEESARESEQTDGPIRIRGRRRAK
jgi:ABC-type iron transport system FetAB ATPase subunit